MSGDERITEMTAQERAFVIAFDLADGEELTTAEIARRAGVTRQGAWALMQRASRVVPVRQSGRVWTRR